LPINYYWELVACEFWPLAYYWVAAYVTLFELSIISCPSGPRIVVFLNLFYGLV